MNLARVRMGEKHGASRAVVARIVRSCTAGLAMLGFAMLGFAMLGALLPAAAWAQASQHPKVPGVTMLHATITVTGGVSFTASFDHGVRAASCADVAKNGTIPPGTPRGLIFEVPVPNTNRTGLTSSVGGGHNYDTDAMAWPYHGPGTYTGASLHGTQLTADVLPNNQETHVFAFPANPGTLVVNADGSGSFKFDGLKDAGSVTISGQIAWTCE
jgi:hypothetical protein